MTLSMSRRNVFAGSLLAIPGLAALSVQAFATDTPIAEAKLIELERKHPGRICVSILDPVTGKRIEYRANERILMCSTFKALAAALVLARVDKGEEKLDHRRIKFPKKGLVPSGSPATETRIGEPGMTVAEICDAAVTRSDNTAGNLLLASFGGPAALTVLCRTLGDDVSRLDRIETELNYHDRDDIRDTTTAAVMLENLRKLLLTDLLSGPSRSQLAAWLITKKTGDTRLRAGLPKNWLVGDKTGTNGDKNGNTNDIAVVWPPDRTPIIVTGNCEIPSIPADERNAVIAEIGRIASQI